MITSYLYLTVFIAWIATGISPDSIGGYPYFSKKANMQCYKFVEAKRTKECISKIEAYDKARCESHAFEFSIKHKQKEEPCIKMKVDVYNEILVKGGKVHFQILDGPDTPILAGYKCKKNKKGKLYACVYYGSSKKGKI